MKLTDIKLVLNRTLPFNDFRLGLSEEMKEYRSWANVQGGTMPVYLIEDINLTIGENELKVLCEAFLNDELSEIEINYVADALLLSNKVSFENERVSDGIDSLTDPEINGHLTKDVVRGILEGY